MANEKQEPSGRVRIKICGITSLGDARTAVESGADYLGYILYERSPRFVAADIIRGITQSIRQEHPHVQHIGVFVNQGLEEICETLDSARLDLAQLHGNEPPSLGEQLAAREYRYLRAMRFGSGAPLMNWQDFPGADFFLCDTFDAKEAGGTGRGFDRALLPSTLPLERTFLAGGLTPENVGAAVDLLHPYAVDVSSGVEEAPGKKSPDKVEAFCAAVRAAL